MALSNKTKNAIKKKYIANEMSDTEIASAYGVSRSTPGRLAKKYKWKRKKQPTPKGEPGRPKKYKKEYDAQVLALCFSGFTNAEIADFFKVNESTIYEWKKTEPSFSKALKDGREKATAQVAASLFKRATGYTHDDEKIFCHDGEIIRAQTKKHYPPDTKAAALWLKAKRPQTWNNEQKIEHSGRMEVASISAEDAEIVKEIFNDIIE